MNKKKSYATLLLILVTQVMVSQAKVASNGSMDSPNILFVFSDDHAWQSIGAYGGRLKEVAHTPNIDKLASEGMLFRKCFVANALCGPSRAAVLTGKYGHRNGVTWNRNTNFDGSQQTFPKMMRQNGYQTAIIGKWHLASVPTGFDYFDVMKGQGRYYNPFLQRGNAEGLQDTRTVVGYNSDIVGDLSIEWLKNGRDKSKPFMLMSQFKATHHGFCPGPEEYDLYDDVHIPEPDNLFDDFSYRGTAIREQTLTLYKNLSHAILVGDPGELGELNPDQRKAWDAYRSKFFEPFQAMNLNWSDQSRELSRFKYQSLLKNFLASGAGIDKNVGRIRAFLQENDLADNTVVIYMADHGFFLGEHGFFDKRFMYEEALRTAFIVHWPGKVEEGVVNDRDIVSNIDIASTFLEMAGIEIPQEIQGRSMVPVLEGKTPDDWRKTFLYTYHELANHNVQPHFGVTDGRNKLIYYPKYNEWEFFDLKKDPQEMISQYFIPENKTVITKLKKELVRLRNQYHCPPVITHRNMNKKANWDYEKRIIPIGVK
jgi:arylsulfatase A-like enzyme